MERLTLQQRHISVLARLFGETVGPKVELDRSKGGRPSKAEIAAREKQPDDAEVAFKTMMDNLFTKGKNGDVASAKLWMEYNAPVADTAFNVEINITPYNIQDRSLPRIVQMADTPVVQEIFEGLKNRLEADEAPRDLKETLRAFRMQYDDWAREAYAAKEL